MQKAVQTILLMKQIFNKYLSGDDQISLIIKSLILLMFLHVFSGAIIGLFQDILPIHEWRKADSLVFALNYIDSNEFFQPHTNFILPNGKTNAAAEFPLIYFLVGKLWYFFGRHILIAKSFSLMLLFTGLVHLALLSNEYFKSHWKSLALLFFVYTSPVLVTYADSCLPNISSFSFLLMACFYFKRYWDTSSIRNLVAFTICLSLTLLFKITALMAVASIIMGMLTFIWLNRSDWKRYKSNVLFLFLSFTFSIIIMVSWYAYAIRYNANHGSNIFSTTIKPFWDFTPEQRSLVWDAIWKKQLPMYHHSFLLILVIIVYVLLAIKGKLSLVVHMTIATGLFAMLAYFILWFCVFDVHDYYLIELLFIPIILFSVMLKNLTSAKHLIITRAFILVLMPFVFLKSMVLISACFGVNHTSKFSSLMVKKELLEDKAYFHWYHENHLLQLQKSVTRLERILDKQAKVLCLSDVSPNVHLFTIMRKGFTGMRIDPLNRTGSINTCIDQGATHLLILERDKWDDTIAQFAKNRLYKFNNVELFSLITR